MRRYKLQVGSTSQKSNPSDPHVTLSQEDLSRWPLSPPFFLFFFSFFYFALDLRRVWTVV